MPTKLSPPARIGFIGLGNMGFPMARRLSEAGFRLIVADRDAGAVQRFQAECGGEPATSLRALGEQADAVITMLPDGNAVREVLLAGDDIVLAGLCEGVPLIDMSSCAPTGTRQLAGQLAARGFPLVDAPVSGGVVKARSGELAIMAGGEAAAIEAARPLFAPLGKLFLTGGPGSGHAMKALNNVLSAGTLALTSEALLAGTRFGLDPHTMVDIINASTGRSNSSEHKFPTFILPRTFDSGFFLGLMAKDLRFARELADAVDGPHELIDAISGLYDQAEGALGFQADNTEIHRYLEEGRD